MWSAPGIPRPSRWTSLLRQCTPDIRRASLAAAVILVAAWVPALPQAAASPAPQSSAQDDARAREAAARADLEESSAAVQAAGLALLRAEGQLPAARTAASVAAGRAAGARARASNARNRARDAEQGAEAARERARAATEDVAAGRRAFAATARRIYQRGRYAGWRTVLDAQRPQDLLERAQMLKSIVATEDRRLELLTERRLGLAQKQAAAARQRRAADRARAQADELARREQVRERAATAAQSRVAALVEQRRAALTTAERFRAADRAEYAAAQQASRDLAAQIRAAAARAEAARRAAARAAAQAAAADAARSSKPATPRRPAPAPARNGRMLWPSDGPMTSRYGYRTHPIYGDRRLHAGIDIGSGSGAPVVAAAAGTVILSYFSESYGNLIVIDHGVLGGRQVTSAYAHQSQRVAQEGDAVSAGELIGRVGSTGNSTGPHLHFEVREDGEPVDPLVGYLDEP